VSANRAFSLCAAAGSLAISVLSAVKGHVAVAIVFGLLFAGFLVRAAEGRAAAASRDTPTAQPRSSHEPERRVKSTRFRRR
jgi:hypothetical protein